MKEYSADSIRNIALVGHSGAGKTSLVEAALFLSGATTRMGTTEEGNTASDFDEEEIRRGISINTTVLPVEWTDHKLNFVDAPGYADFVGDMIGALHAVDGAVVVVDAVAGVEVGTEIAWQQLDAMGLPRVVVINMMNRDNAKWQRVLADLESAFDARFVPLQLPIGEGPTFKGVYRLISETVSLGPKATTGDLPDAVKAAADDMREAIIEAAAESDDDLILKYLEGEELTGDEIRHGLVQGAKTGRYVPVFFTAATEGIGVGALLDSVITALPSPTERTARALKGDEEVALKADMNGPLVAQVFKTIADPYVGKLQYLRVFSGSFDADSRATNVTREEEERVGPVYVVVGKEQVTVGRVPAGDIGAVAKLHVTETGDTLADKGSPYRMPPFEYPQSLYAVALTPEGQADSTKLGSSLQKLAEEDPSLHWETEPTTHELVLSGMGDAHVDVARRRLLDKYGVHVTAQIPKVPYRETLSHEATTAYRHKKQTGGAGQFAEVHLRVEPLPRGGGFEYASEVFGGAISHQFIPSIEKGIRQALIDGIVAGFPVVDTKAIVTDGKEHPVDSKDIAFQIAGREAYKDAIMAGGPILLEPVYDVRVVVPSEQMGDVLGDLNTRRAIVQGMEQEGKKAIVRARVPLAEMQRYSTDLRSMTQGRGYYLMEFSHFAEVPHQVAEGIIAKVRQEKEEQHA
jgi:elongation factor G